MLPGMLNPMFMSSSSNITFSLINTGTSTTESISIPSGAAAGDFGLLYQYVTSDAAPTFGTPSGWTLIKRTTAGSITGFGSIHARILTSASGTVSTGSVANGGGEIATCIKIFRPSSPLVSIVPSTWNEEINNGNPTLQTTNPSAQTTSVIVAALSGARSSTYSLSTESPTFTKSTLNQAVTHVIFGHTIYSTAPLSQSTDMNDEGSCNVLMSGYFTFT